MCASLLESATHGLSEHTASSRQQSSVGPTQGSAFGIPSEWAARDLGDLALTSSDAPAHVAKAPRRGHPLRPRTLDVATEHLGDVFAKTRVARMADGRLDDRRVDAHLSTPRDASCGGQLHDALEQRTEALALQELSETHHYFCTAV